MTTTVSGGGDIPVRPANGNHPAGLVRTWRARREGQKLNVFFNQFESRGLQAKSVR